MSRNRSGFILIELGAAVIVITAVFALTLQCVHFAQEMRRASHQHEVALAEANNVVEQIYTWQYDELTDERLSQISISDQAATALPKSQLKVMLDDLDNTSRGSRVTVDVQWSGGAGRPPRSVRITAWRFPTQRE